MDAGQSEGEDGVTKLKDASTIGNRSACVEWLELNVSEIDASDPAYFGMTTGKLGQ